MSWNVIRGVRDSDLSLIASHLLLIMISYPNREGVIFAKIDRMALDAKLSNSGVRKALTELKSRSIVVEIGQRAYNVKEYVIDEDALRRCSRLEARECEPPESPPPGASAPHHSGLRAPERHAVATDPPPGSAPERHEVAGSPPHGSGLIQRKEPPKEPPIETTEGMRGEGGVVRADDGPPDLVAYALAAIATVPDWSMLPPQRLPDRAFLERELRQCREAGADDDRILSALDGFGEWYAAKPQPGMPRANLESWLSKRRKLWAEERNALDRGASNRRRDEAFEARAGVGKAAPVPEAPQRPVRVVGRHEGFVVVLAENRVAEKYEGDGRAGKVHPSRELAAAELLGLGGGSAPGGRPNARPPAFVKNSLV